MNTQVCIATDQQLANVIPILYFHPEKIIIIATVSYKDVADKLEKTLHNFGFSDISIIKECPDTNLVEIKKFFKQKLEPELPQEACRFNITGGKKLHSLAVYEFFKERRDDDEIIYADTPSKSLEFLKRPLHDENLSNTKNLSDILDVKKTLLGMGKQYISSVSDKSGTELDTEYIRCKELTDLFAAYVDDERVKDFHKKLRTASNRKIAQSFKLTNINDALEKILNKAHNLQLIQWNKNNNDVTVDTTFRDYLADKWLEHYVYLIAKKIGFHDVHSNIKYSYQNLGIGNSPEIDLFIVHNNLSLAAECKAGSSENIRQKEIANLDMVADKAGGLTCSKLLISCEKLDNSTHAHAKEQKPPITIIESTEIVDKLPKILENWKDKGRL